LSNVLLKDVSEDFESHITQLYSIHL